MPDDNTGLDYGYDSYLEQVPEALRDQIKPAFENYSAHVKESTQRYEPFGEILDQGWTPEHVTAGLGLLQELNNNPQRVIQALVEQDPSLAQQFAPQQIAPTGPPASPPPVSAADMSDAPPWLVERLNQQEELTRLLYEGFNQQQQMTTAQQQAAQEQQELEQFSKQLDTIAPEAKYPRQFILSYISQGQSPQQAVQSFEAWKTQELSAQRGAGAPLIAPAGGGGLPSEPIDTSKLTDAQRRDLMVQYMNRANEQR